MSDKSLGPTETFTGAMGAPITRNVKEIQILDAATFTVLQFMYANQPPSTGAVSPETVPVYPTVDKLHHVKSFQLASGAIKVVYYT